MTLATHCSLLPTTRSLVRTVVRGLVRGSVVKALVVLLVCLGPVHPFIFIFNYHYIHFIPYKYNIIIH